jgi:murein DD-endopeptidase
MQWRMLTRSVTIWMLCAVTTAWAQARQPMLHSLDVQVPVAPVSVAIGGRTHLVYELHLTNFTSADAVLTRIEVLDAKSGRKLVEYVGANLASRLDHPGVKRDTNQEMLEGGRRAVMFMWLPLDSAAPSAVEHRVAFDLRTEVTRSGVVRTGPTRLANESVTVLRAPLRGGPWVALYDPLMARGHRKTFYAIDGRARIPARFAIDWVRLGNDASVARGDRGAIANWHGYAAEVLAVADGVIAAAVDDMAESASTTQSQAPMALEQASGNHVILDLDKGRYAFYEHLKHGSIRVRPGERVRAGQVLALLGNSGSSSAGPHLHFHLADAPSTLAAEGIPFVFERFEVDGQFERIGDFRTGRRWNAVSQQVGGIRKLEFPDANTVVIFK